MMRQGDNEESSGTGAKSPQAARKGETVGPQVVPEEQRP